MGKTNGKITIKIEKSTNKEGLNSSSLFFFIPYNYVVLSKPIPCKSEIISGYEPEIND